MICSYADCRRDETGELVVIVIENHPDVARTSGRFRVISWGPDARVWDEVCRNVTAGMFKSCQAAVLMEGRPG